ncbi:PIN domain-containing protein [Hymenobacter cavernae]|uniref:PIN domain-containing protein n=1 Tax=Hymenobacter cavernae TaxID=2044852 RepID=A0ABQ1UIV3_9BACT|nr:PIN domain-containing protein [Hymenobacter cavernae]GGF19137.1 hypothetical protein GCM10011383_33310 [Hymenobacter cavernae]
MSALAQADTWISTQVLTEFINVSSRKFKTPWPVIMAGYPELVRNFSIHTNTPTTILRATEVAQRYGFLWFDSLIVAAALECGCQTLYSEDLQHGQLLANTLSVVNPFI